MLHIVTQIDENTVSRLFSVYAESMADLQTNFTDAAEMRAAYTAFLRDFIAAPNHLIAVEASDDRWVSGLRAIETAAGHWFLEAVETKPEERRKGFGKDLLLHTMDYLHNLGMTELTCTISRQNGKSQALHEACGFVPTCDPPVNCWGEPEEQTILYRYER